MTKTFVIIACFSWPFATAIAQSNHLKLYLGFELADRPELELSSDSNPVSSLRQAYSSAPFYALAFGHENINGDFWEISGQTNVYAGYQPAYDHSRLDTILVNPVGKLRNNYAQLQYEYNWFLGADDDRKMRPYLGIFIRASGQRANFQASSSNYFSLETSRIALSPGFIPRIVLRSGGRLRLEFSAPIVFGSFSFDDTTVENPVLTPRQQHNGNFDLDIFSLETQIRLGFAYRLNKLADSKASRQEVE